MIKIGITGGIGSGKSTVCRMFSQMGVPVFDTDSEAKLIMRENPHVKEQIIRLFGNESYIGNELNRSYIAESVFGNDTMLQRLNSIVHPAVAKEFCRWALSQAADYVIMECAILFESGFDKIVDKSVTVSAPLPLRIERTIKRDNISEKAAEARIAHQISDTLRESKADYIIYNTDLDEVRTQVEKLDKIFRNESRKA